MNPSSPNLPAEMDPIKDLMRAGRYSEVERACREMLNSAPGHGEARLFLANCMMLRDELAGARFELQGILEQDPRNQTARNLLGEVFLRLGEWGEIRRELEKRLEPFSGPTTDFERACLKLRFGDMREGWQEYEARWRIPEFQRVEQHYAQPRWDGSPFPGQTLLLHWEQGFGDTLMFVRYASQAKALGGRVVLAAQAQLADLVATCPGVDEVIPHGQILPSFDLHCPLLSLPGVFRTDLDSVPAEIPYLDLPARVPNRGRIARLLAPGEGKVRVGLAWAGSTLHKNDARRTIPAEALAVLQEAAGVAWYSFQVGRSEEMPFPGIVPLESVLSNFSDTAYALSAMDLVITVDTALAHLAGAMGIPTLLLLSSLPDWRWMMGRQDSPWYPTMRLYRQPGPGDWEGVLRQVVGDLAS